MTRHPNQRAPHTLPRELRRTTVPGAVRDWVARTLGAAVTGVRRLPGASSTAVHALDLSDGRRVVLRRYVWQAYLAAEPGAPAEEADALRFTAAKGLPVPDLLACDPTGATIGDGVPALLMSRLRGRAVAEPDLDALAAVAATIHGTDTRGFEHEYFPWYQDTTAAPPPTARRPALWHEAIRVWHEEMPPFRPVLIHRDFHPGNVLWWRGRLGGVVDWTSACRGPWGCDVAHCRANLIALSGPAAADRFLAAYEAITGERFDPFWDLASVLEHGPSYWTPAEVEVDERRLREALDRLTPPAGRARGR